MPHLKRREWFNSLLWVITRESFACGARAFLALCSVFLIHSLANWQADLLPIMLGIVASALTETDDHWRPRLRSQLIALCTFAALNWAIWMCLPWPALLAIVISTSAFTLTMLGAIGDRYRAITFGSLVLVLYAAISAHESRELALISMPLLIIGATWYGIISVLWVALLPEQAVQAKMAKLYTSLAEYLTLKAQLLEPIREIDQAERRMTLVLQNGRVVNALNSAKESLLSRIQHHSPYDWLKLSMHQYLVAQDIHERTSSSHEDYKVLTKAFFHSDVLYRCQRTLILLGKQAAAFSNAIQSRSKPIHHGVTKRSIEDLSNSISNLEKESPRDLPIQALNGVKDNLTSMATAFSSAFIPPNEILDQSLHDCEPATISEAWILIKKQLTLESPLFRHALRLSASLLIGFTVMKILQDHLGYWILLTILFVSQQQYAATHKRLIQRALGTALGLAVGWALTQLFTETVIQSALIVVVGAIFFGTRHTRYILATGAITTLLVISFHQIGMRQELFPARLWDTIIGCTIAGVAAWLVLPNWQWRLWPNLAARSLNTQADYLLEIINQYKLGKEESLPYRFARREAHNADAALSNAYSAMLKEPEKVRISQEEKGRFLIASHTLLNYISALGAHRSEWSEKYITLDLLKIAIELHKAMKDIATMITLSNINSSNRSQELYTQLMKLDNIDSYLSHEDAEEVQKVEEKNLVYRQLNLCINILSELKSIARINDAIKKH